MNATKSGIHHDQGLYDRRYDHDACGVGLICHIKGQKSHQIITDGLKILVNLTHRGACGCDESTGDGAGILMQMPDAFLRRVAEKSAVSLPPFPDYGCGLIFLPPEETARKSCQALIEKTVIAEGQQFLGWRPVPVDSRALGSLAGSLEPAIYQAFIAKGSQITDNRHFERKLYVIRKVIENSVRRRQKAASRFFHIASLSSQTLIYKGMLLADQIQPFYPDLSAEDMLSALALVHQRYSTNTFPTWDLAQPFRFLCHNGEINTLQGNRNWLNARQHLFRSELFGADMTKLLPILSDAQLESVRACRKSGLGAATLSTLYPASEKGEDLAAAARPSANNRN